MVDPYPYHKRLLAVGVLFAGLFWAGLALLITKLTERYLPQAGPEHQLAVLASVIILAYLALYIGRARRVAYLHGHAVAIGPKQYPDLHARIRAACKRLGIDHEPAAFLFQDTSLGHSFALRFAGEDYLALNGELIGALTERQGAIDFYIGYELGRLHERYVVWTPFLFPATVLPLVGAAYERARTYTLDRYGLAGSKARVDAAFALAVQAGGSRRWKSFNIAEFSAQSARSRSFWMSVIDLSSAQPWLAKRIAHLRAIATASGAFFPRRHLAAYLIALFIPNVRLRRPWGWLRGAVVVLWIAVVVHAGVLGVRAAARLGWLDFIESQFQNKLVVFPRTPVATPKAPAPRARTDAAPVSGNAYASLDADLKVLGEAALARQQKHGGIPCEVGNIGALKLNYRTERYAFSCNETTVYTVIEPGEFEAGRGAHLRIYDWKEKRMITGPNQTNSP